MFEQTYIEERSVELEEFFRKKIQEYQHQGISEYFVMDALGLSGDHKRPLNCQIEFGNPKEGPIYFRHYNNGFTISSEYLGFHCEKIVNSALSRIFPGMTVFNDLTINYDALCIEAKRKREKEGVNALYYGYSENRIKCIRAFDSLSQIEFSLVYNYLDFWREYIDYKRLQPRPSQVSNYKIIEDHFKTKWILELDYVLKHEIEDGANFDITEIKQLLDGFGRISFFFKDEMNKKFHRSDNVESYFKATIIFHSIGEDVTFESDEYKSWEIHCFNMNFVGAPLGKNLIRFLVLDEYRQQCKSGSCIYEILDEIKPKNYPSNRGRGQADDNGSDEIPS